MAAKSTPHPIDVHVGARLMFRRKQIRVSQSSLGEALGVTFQQIQKYERGANRMSASMLFMAGQRLSAPIDFFFDGLPSERTEVIDMDTGNKVLAAVAAVPAVQSIGSLDRKTQNALQLLISSLVKCAG